MTQKEYFELSFIVEQYIKDCQGLTTKDADIQADIGIRLVKDIISTFPKLEDHIDEDMIDLFNEFKE